MIVKMMKYNFLLYHLEFQSFLDDVQAIGVLDITKESRTLTDDEKDILEFKARCTSAIKSLSHRHIEADKRFDRSSLDVVTRWEDAAKELEAAETNLRKLSKELNDLQPWGDFNPSDISALEAKGLTLKYFVAPTKRFSSEWEEQYAISVVSDIKGQTYFVWVQEKGETTFSLPATEVKVLPRSLRELTEEVEVAKSTKENLIAELDELSLYTEMLSQSVIEQTDSLDFKSILNGTPRELEGTVVMLTGFVPEEVAPKLEAYLAETSTIYISQKAKEEDGPPIKLKNNKFARLFEPIGELYIPPKYSELDLTPYFAPFFVIFFGLCMNDIGYGIVYLLLGTILRMMPRFAKHKPYLMLIQWLGLGTFIMGFVSGSIFGTEMGSEHEWMFLPEHIKHLFLKSDQMMLFAVAVGFVQIIAGLMVKAANRMRHYGSFFAGLGPIGWVLLLSGLLLLAFPSTKPFAKYVIGTGVTGVLFFGHPHGNIFGRIGMGLVELYEISGFFGDLLSYIRLFALGIAAAILAMVVNTIAELTLHAFPYGIGYLIFGIIVVFGHAANMMLSTLGAFVHPLRLTFVEFYKNSGFSGGGRMYSPFKRSASQESKITN